MRTRRQRLHSSSCYFFNEISSLGKGGDFCQLGWTFSHHTKKCYRLSEPITIIDATTEVNPFKNNVVFTIPEWGPTFHIRFDLMMLDYDSDDVEWRSLLRFTSSSTSTDYSAMGDRVPALFANKKGYLAHTMASDGKPNNLHYSPTNSVKINTWYTIEYLQQFDEGQVFH